MIVIIFFWSAVLSIIFYLLCTVFKVLASLFTGILNTAVHALAITIIGVVTMGVTGGLYAITKLVIEDGWGAVFSNIFYIIVTLAVVGSIIGGLGSALYELVVEMVMAVIAVIEAVLEYAGAICEAKYEHFLQVIINRLDRC